MPLPGGGAAVYTVSGLTYYRHADWLGSGRLATTPVTRTTYFDVAYGPYGEGYASSGSVDLDFTGQTQDTVSGLYDFLCRQYNANQGRWPRPDPAGRRAVNMANPQTWNRYAYVGNKPLTATDALGLLSGWSDVVGTGRWGNVDALLDPGGAWLASENQQFMAQAGLNSPIEQDFNNWYQPMVDAGFNALQNQKYGIPTPPANSTALSQWLIEDGQNATVAAIADELDWQTAYNDNGSVADWWAVDFTHVAVYSVDLNSLPDLVSANGSDPALYFFRRAGWPLRGTVKSLSNGEPNRLTLSHQDALIMCTVTMGNGDLNSGDDPNLDEQARSLAPLVMAGDVANCVGSMSRP